MSTSKVHGKRPAYTAFEEFTLSDVLGESSEFTTQSLSKDRRRTHVQTQSVELPSPLKKKKQREVGFFADVGDGFEYVFDDLAAPPAPIQQTSDRGVKPRAKRYLSSVNKYLAEFIRHEGRSDVCTTHCPTCPPNTPPETPRFRCMDCMIPDLFCQECCVRAHSRNPLDRIERWDGTKFKHTSPKDMGLRIQLGHRYGEVCETPIAAHKKFLVIHTNRIHNVSVDFCGCVDETIVGLRRQQLLRRSWYPATHKEPQTCTMFQALELFHIMTLQGKVTTYDFYTGLEKLTTKSGLVKVKDWYKAFMQTMRQWRHLVMLKRGGRGNDSDHLVAETKPGELAVVCPVCPQPGVNLPTNWELASGEERFLYILYIAIDACIRLKRCLISSEKKDPGLGTGLSYFTEDPPFRKYLLSVTDQREMSTCSSLAALDYANTKFSCSYGSTGVGLGVCAHHEFVQRNGAVDLQYANMDYSLVSLLRHHHRRLRKFLLYDICCQWSKYLVDRLKQLPNGIRLDLILKLVSFVIPKLHIYGHKLLCQLNFSLNFTLGAAQTDGEGIERPWANIGLVATSTREMGPGSRHDTFNDYWGHWNWEKLTGLGTLLKKHLLCVIPERNFQRESLATFTENQAEHVGGWMAMVQAFEVDNTQPNPYELLKSGATENDLRLKLMQEEAADEVSGRLPIHNVSPSAFVIAGLDLEEQGCCIKVAVAAHKSESSMHSTNIVEKRTKLSRYLARFRKVQAVYMPGALQALADLPVVQGVGTLAENIPLVPPSALSGELRASGCNKGVDSIELQLWDKQCQNALDEIRHYLHVKLRFRTYKGSQVRHQGVMTRARDLMNRNDEKIRMQAEKYGEAGMEEDIREGVAEGQRWRDPTGEGRRTISWIWMGTDTSSAMMSEAVLRGLRVEWCKAWARTRCWTEEVLLLWEEMRRRARRTLTGFEGVHAEGAAAYAMRQAELYSDLAEQFETLWAPVRDLEALEGEEIIRAAAADQPPDSEDEDELAGPDNGAEASAEGPVAGAEDVDDGVNEEEEEQNEEEEEGSVGGLED
ncbi:hypothetical protein B0H14DRAFT_3098532 [Mycena olivaceomarginata]|nr:hypothetical protein B0H14DRAFT_3098532 [Mycena olivaceomarginata]